MFSAVTRSQGPSHCTEQAALLLPTSLPPAHLTETPCSWEDSQLQDLVRSVQLLQSCYAWNSMHPTSSWQLPQAHPEYASVSKKHCNSCLGCPFQCLLSVSPLTCLWQLWSIFYYFLIFNSEETWRWTESGLPVTKFRSVFDLPNEQVLSQQASQTFGLLNIARTESSSPFQMSIQSFETSEINQTKCWTGTKGTGTVCKSCSPR